MGSALTMGSCPASIAAEAKLCFVSGLAVALPFSAWLLWWPPWLG
jgi:hypothetical protein